MAIRKLTMSTTGMAFDPKTGESFQLNASAKFILELLHQGKTPEEVAKEVSKKFKIDYEQALTDVLEFQVQIQIMGVAA